MRRLIVPVVTFSCLCCATLPRATRTDVHVSGGLSRAQWTEPTTGCASFPPARQIDEQVQVGIAVTHENASGLELGGSVEGQRETVTASRDHPSPPDGARDYLLAGGGYVGGRWQHFAIAGGASFWNPGGIPYFAMEAGRLDKVWARLQVGRWRPFTDTRVATLGGAFKPFEGGQLEIWTGAVAPTLYVYPVANRILADARLADTQWGLGLTMSAQISDFFAIFLQLAGSQTPSGFIGLSFSPSALLESDPGPAAAPPGPLTATD